MPDRKRIITIGGTLAAIAGIGFFMQSGQSPQTDMAMSANAPIEVLEISDAELTASDMQETPQPESTAPAAEEIAATEAETAGADAAAMETAALADEPAIQMPAMPEYRQNAAATAPAAQPQPGAQPETQPDALATTAGLSDNVITVAPENDAAVPMPSDNADMACSPEMTAEPMAAALVKIVLKATCLPNERVTMEHAGMSFTEATDAEGMLELSVPALEEQAEFSARFLDGHTVTASAKVNSLAFYDRAVIQSDSDSAVSLHALEYGAGYEDAGHVWAQAGGGIEKAATGKGGFMILLGDPSMDKGRIAEVYTFPTGIAQENGDVELSVEISVTEMNCGRPIKAQSLQTVTNGAVDVQTLELTMPDCDAVGDFLVLKNLVNDLKVARN